MTISSQPISDKVTPNPIAKVTFQQCERNLIDRFYHTARGGITALFKLVNKNFLLKGHALQTKYPLSLKKTSRSMKRNKL